MAILIGKKLIYFNYLYNKFNISLKKPTSVLEIGFSGIFSFPNTGGSAVSSGTLTAFCHEQYF